MTCIKKIQNTEVFGSKFSSRTLTTAGDISGYTFKAVVKNIIQGKILEIPGVKNAGTINFDFSQLETLKKSTYKIEYWGDFGALGNEPFLLEELSIVSAENATNCANSDNLNFEIKIEEISIPVTITKAINNFSLNIENLTPEQIALLKGEKGDAGEKGDTGDNGSNGNDGASAYEIAVQSGFVGAESQWLSSLKGEKGDKGEQGVQSEKGDKGDKGEQGIQGEKGDTGEKGDKGDKGDAGEMGLQGIQGIQGIKGDKGEKGDKGDAFTYADFTPTQIAELQKPATDKIVELNTLESTLVNSENTRISNENNRISAENSRVTAESLRVTAENARAAAEIERQKNKGFTVKVTTPSNWVTRTTSETEVLRIEIPANSLSASDVLRMPYLPISKLGSVIVQIRIKLSTSPTMPSGTTDQIAQYLNPPVTSKYIGMTRTYKIYDGQIWGFTFTENGITDITTNVNNGLSSKPFNRSETNYLYVSLKLGDSADQARLEGIQLTNS